MTTWVFDGIGLPAGEQVHLEAGSGEPQPLPGRFVLPGLVDSHCHLTFRFGEHGPVLIGEKSAATMLDELARVRCRRGGTASAESQLTPGSS